MLSVSTALHKLHKALDEGAYETAILEAFEIGRHLYKIKQETSAKAERSMKGVREGASRGAKAKAASAAPQLHLRNKKIVAEAKRLRKRGMPDRQICGTLEGMIQLAPKKFHLGSKTSLTRKSIQKILREQGFLPRPGRNKD